MCEKMPLTCLYGAHGAENWPNLVHLEDAVLSEIASGSHQILAVLEMVDITTQESDKILADTKVGISPLAATYSNIGLIKRNQDLKKHLFRALDTSEGVYWHCALDILDRVNEAFPGRIQVLHENCDNLIEVGAHLEWVSEMLSNYLECGISGQFDIGVNYFVTMIEQDTELHMQREKRIRERIEKTINNDGRIGAVIVKLGTMHTSFPDLLDKNTFQIKRIYMDGLPVFFSPADSIQRSLMRNPQRAYALDDLYRTFLGAVYFDLLPEVTDSKAINDDSLIANLFARSFKDMKDIRKFEADVRRHGWQSSIAARNFWW